MSEDIKSTIEAGLAAGKGQRDEKLAAHTADVEKYGKATTELTGKIDTLSEQYKAMKEQLIEVAQNTAKAPSAAEDRKSAGNQFIASEKFKNAVKGMLEGKNDKVRTEVKYTQITSDLGALFSDGNSVLPYQRPGVIPGDFTPTTVRDVIQTINISSGGSIEALREADWTNNAAPVAQGEQKPESILELEPYTVTLRTVAHWLKVTNQLLQDAPAIAQYIDGRLRHGLAVAVDNQLINGNGTSPNLSGLLDAGNFTAFTPASGANLVESINKAKYEM